MVEDKSSFDRYLKENRRNLGTAIHELWKWKDLWEKEPYFYLKLGELADRCGQFMFARDVLEEGVSHSPEVKEGERYSPEELRLWQLYALSLIKCGYLVRARDLLTRLVTQGYQDEETLGILGRVYKEMWLIADEGAPGSRYLRHSRNQYLRAFQGSRGSYSGINAASLSLIMGEARLAEKLARLVARDCFARLKKVRDPRDRDYWSVATMGEAFLLLRRQDQAARYYRMARGLSRDNYSTLASTRRQLKLLSRYIPVDEAVMQTLGVPPVVAFTGHMLDASGRKRPRFPESAVQEVSAGIESVLARLGARIGYSSAACGGDLLFLECLQRRGGEANVILPFDRQEFMSTSVAFAGPGWVRRVQDALKRARVEEANPGGYDGEDRLFSFANRLILGKTIQRSRFLETTPHLIAVWDGRRNAALGGTAEFVESWRQTGFPLTVIEPRTGEIREKAAPRPGRARCEQARPLRVRPGEVRREVVAILFADLVGYSRFGEDQVPSYIQGFLGTLAARLEGSAHTPLFKNIWGDAIFFVFRDFVAAAEAAMEVRDMVRDTDWQTLGLPQDLSIRVGLHAGPVYYALEPVLKRLNFFGHHVNHAARIEPITSAGNVYASEQFAALMIADPRNRLDCKYVGVIVLPKGFGQYPVYHIKRQEEIG